MIRTDAAMDDRSGICKVHSRVEHIPDWRKSQILIDPSRLADATIAG